MLKKIITICSSASFYRECLEVEKALKKLGFRVKVPHVAYLMKKTNNFNVRSYKTWFTNRTHYKRKTYLMRHHIKKVIESDAILVVNNTKNGIYGYIGGNGLIEMAIAFHYSKPIFIYRNIDKKHPLAEEIYGLNPVFIKEDLFVIQRRLR